MDVAQEWGWVQEMYAFTITCYMQGVGPIDTYSKMMAQPPGQTTMDPYYLLHYTYGLDYTLEGVHMPGEYGPWRFDKRTYQDQPPPRNLGDPPKGMKNDLVSQAVVALTCLVFGLNLFLENSVFQCTICSIVKILKLPVVNRSNCSIILSWIVWG